MFNFSHKGLYVNSETNYYLSNSAFITVASKSYSLAFDSQPPGWDGQRRNLTLKKTFSLNVIVVENSSLKTIWINQGVLRLIIEHFYNEPILVANISPQKIYIVVHLQIDVKALTLLSLILHIFNGKHMNFTKLVCT